LHGLLSEHYFRRACFAGRGIAAAYLPERGSNASTHKITRCLSGIIPAGPASGVSFTCSTKHIMTARFGSFLFLLRGLHIPGRSLTRSTVACKQQGVGACRPA